jgi:hypothetical protein
MTGILFIGGGEVHYDTGYTNHFWDTPESRAYFAELNAGYFADLEMQDDATIEGHRYPRPTDRMMARYDEAVRGNLPSDQELDAYGVNRAALAMQLRKGMNARKFTRAVELGFDVSILNEQLDYLVDRPSINIQLDAYLEHCRRERRRERRAANRVLAIFFERM